MDLQTDYTLVVAEVKTKEMALTDQDLQAQEAEDLVEQDQEEAQDQQEQMAPVAVAADVITMVDLEEL
jgi:low affinity Fe/Cu permease